MEEAWPNHLAPEKNAFVLFILDLITPTWTAQWSSQHFVLPTIAYLWLLWTQRDHIVPGTGCGSAPPFSFRVWPFRRQFSLCTRLQFAACGGSARNYHGVSMSWYSTVEHFCDHSDTKGEMLHFFNDARSVELADNTLHFLFLTRMCRLGNARTAGKLCNSLSLYIYTV